MHGDSGFPLSLSEWSFTIYPTPYNRKYNVLSASLNKHFIHLNGVDTWTEPACAPGSGVAPATRLGVPAQYAERCGIDVVDDVVLTHATNARLEKGQGIAQAIPGQGCVQSTTPVWLIWQCALLRCPVERRAHLDEHQTGVRQRFVSRYRGTTGLSPFPGIPTKVFCGDN